ncbi:class III signal peptide-containing protein [Candidatus Pyrohabitans sp.]
MRALRDSRGQISIEFIILVGAIMVMVIAVFPYILRSNELSKAHAAARDGATFAAGMRGLGYKGENVNELPSGVVKITGVEMIRVGNYSNLDWYRFNISISAPSYMIDDPTCTQSSLGSTITNQALQYVYYAFNGEWWDSGFISNVTTNRYRFTATCNFE